MSASPEDTRLLSPSSFLELGVGSLQAATGAQGQTRRCGRTVRKHPTSVLQETRRPSAWNIWAHLRFAASCGLSWPRNRRNLPSPSWGGWFPGSEHLSHVILCICLWACLSPWGRARLASPVLSHGVTRPGTWLGLNLCLNVGCQNLTEPSRFQNCPATPASFQSPAPPKGQRWTPSPSWCPQPPPFPVGHCSPSSLKTARVPRAPLPGPFTSAGWSVLPLAQAACAVSLASGSLGTRKTKFIIWLPYFFFLSFFPFFPPKNEASTSLPSSERALNMAGHWQKMSSFSEGRNATVNNKKKKTLGFMGASGL